MQLKNKIGNNSKRGNFESVKRSVVKKWRWIIWIISMENSNTMNPSTPSTISAPPQAAAGGTSWFSGIVRGRSASAKMPNNVSVAAAGDGVGGGSGPINKKRQFRGAMFKYGPKPIQVREFDFKILEKCENYGKRLVFFLSWFWS